MRKSLILLLGVIMTTLPISARAGGIPVIDTAAIAQMAVEFQLLEQQYAQMLQEYARQGEELQEATHQTEALTGKRAMGDLLNGMIEQHMRYYVPSDLDDLIDIGSGSVAASASNVQTTYQQLEQTYSPLGTTDFGNDNAGLPNNAAYMQRSNTTFATLAASREAYNNVSKRMKGFEMLLQKLNDSEDMKTTADLTARIQAENGVIMNELLRMQAMQLQLMAASNNHNLTSHRSLHEKNKYLPMPIPE